VKNKIKYIINIYITLKKEEKPKSKPIKLEYTKGKNKLSSFGFLTLK
jgi:hypothetical protein